MALAPIVVFVVLYPSLQLSSFIRAFGSGGERFLHTEEVTSSNLVTPTTDSQVIGFSRWPVFDSVTMLFFAVIVTV